MSKLNINRNTFLEREELLRFQEFMAESAVNQTFLANTLEWGIIDTSGGVSPLDFKVVEGSATGTIRMQSLSRALTSSNLMIKQSPIDNIAIPNDSSWYWVKISHKYTNEEQGTISITTDGQISGIGTYFTEVLRGQSTEVPVRIKFTNSINNVAIYEVVDVTGDDTAILLGNDFTEESNLKYAVIGSIPLGDTVTSLQQEGLYFYDSCQIDLVSETVSETEPAGKIQDEEFWIARVRNVSGTITIEDKRTEYWEYYIRGVSDKLTASKNLSDVADTSTSRDNLDVYSKQEVDNLTGTVDSGYLSMTRVSPNIQSTDFSIKVRKIGKIVNITGTYRKAQNLAAGTISFQISLSSLPNSLPPVNVYSNPITALEAEENRGDQFVIEAATGTETNLNVKCYSSNGSADGAIKTINITYLSI